jgi:hypothetical protein
MQEFDLSFVVLPFDVTEHYMQPTIFFFHEGRTCGVYSHLTFLSHENDAGI